MKNPNLVMKELFRVTEGPVIIGVYSKEALQMQLRNYKRIGLKGLTYNQDTVRAKGGLISRRFSESRLRKIAQLGNRKLEIPKRTRIGYVALMKQS